ncbi:MAG TPA: hypothetical protein VMH05_16110 [Bryobacteraceae bacterium]|nr:hypothetical protein [Bryobacteraceae bacterium]
MRHFRFTPLSLSILPLIGLPCGFVQAQETSAMKGLPPRAAPSEYQAQAKAGAVTIGAEFMAHSVPTPEAIYETEDYVVVEVGLFGPPQATARLSTADFSLRINGSKKVLPNQPYLLAFKSLKDPAWEPPKSEDKSKSSFSTGGGAGGNPGDPPPLPPKMPLELRRAMEQHVERSAMLEGDRPLPQAGLLFFEYRGKIKNINSLELIYSGAAGNATLALHP